MRPRVLHWIILLSCVTQIIGHVHDYDHAYNEKEEKVAQHNRHRHVPKDKHPDNSLDTNAIIEPKFHRFRFPSRTCSQKNWLVQNVEVYGNWSDWSDCMTKHCIQVRYRTCLDNSWEQSDWCNVHSNHCISKHIVEKRSCQNKTTCNSHITAQRVANLLQTCGRRAGSQEMLKIVGGFETEHNSWPWAVRISYRISSKQSVSFCGGTLVAPHVILTAAHCLLVQNKRLPTGKLLRLDDYNSGSLYAHLGSHYRSKRTEGQQDFRITHAILHPKYHRSLLADGDDIALIFLSTPVEITETVQYACLPNSTTTFPPGTKCRAVGWGSTETGSKPTFDMLEHPFFNLFLTDHFDNIFYPFPLDVSQILRPPRRYTRTRRPKDFTSEALREVELETVSFDKCRKYYRSLDKHRTLCAGTDGKDTCTGDSGGGLYCQLPGTDQWVVSGVTSYGLARGCGLHPGVYTSVAGHMDWITQHLIQPIH